jgi:hypothetical protein
MEPNLAHGVLRSLDFTVAEVQAGGADSYNVKLLKGHA